MQSRQHALIAAQGYKPGQRTGTWKIWIAYANARMQRDLHCEVPAKLCTFSYLQAQSVWPSDGRASLSSDRRLARVGPV